MMPLRRLRRTCLLPLTALALTLALSACGEDGAVELPRLGVQTNATSVSGISSGAYMAGQFQFAHSRQVVGAAVIAGGPYGCAESLFADIMPMPGAAMMNLTKAINGCMLNGMKMFGVPNPGLLADKARRLAADNKIDPIEFVKDDKVYLFSGKEDRTVVPAIVAAAEEFYRDAGVPAAQIDKIDDMPAGHAFITLDKGLACQKSGEPYIVDCDYDQAGKLLAHIYGELKPVSNQQAGNLKLFDQKPFTADLFNHGMSDRGFVYVPDACRHERCRVHIAFHGCAQNRALVGDEFAKDTGFSRWADTNKLVILFPQTSTTPLNPQGCWDWWGYTGREYLTRSAPQITAVHRMLEWLGGTRAGA